MAVSPGTALFSPHSHSHTLTLNFWDPSLTVRRDISGPPLSVNSTFCCQDMERFVGMAHAFGVVDGTGFMDWLGWVIETS